VWIIWQFEELQSGSILNVKPIVMRNLAEQFCWEFDFFQEFLVEVFDQLNQNVRENNISNFQLINGERNRNCFKFSKNPVKIEIFIENYLNL
jgi:hypothetical protein